MVGKLCGEMAVGGVVLGRDHDAARLLVEAVDDTGSPDAANAGQAVAAMMDQRIDQCSGPVAGARVDDKAGGLDDDDDVARSEEHTSELQSLMRISYAVFCLKKKTHYNKT